MSPAKWTMLVIGAIAVLGLATVVGVNTYRSHDKVAKPGELQRKVAKPANPPATTPLLGKETPDSTAKPPSCDGWLYSLSSVKPEVLTTIERWNVLHDGSCLVVWEVSGKVEAKDAIGKPFLLSEKSNRLTRHFDRVRGTGEIKYSLCPISLAGELLNWNCTSRNRTAGR